MHFQCGNCPICTLRVHPFVHIPGLLPGLEIDYSSLSHPGCQETTDMHTFNYESIEFCDVCFIFICIPHAAHRRRYYARFTICYAQFFSPTDPRKSLSYFFLHSLSPCSSLRAGLFICWLHQHKCKTVLSVPVLWPA